MLDKLPPEYDSRVKGMEVDEKPQDQCAGREGGGRIGPEAMAGDAARLLR